MNATLDKARLKSLLIEVITEKPELLTEIIEEIFNKVQTKETEPLSEKQQKIQEIMNKDFEKYDDVFRKLA